MLQDLENSLNLADSYDKLNEFKYYLEEKQLNCPDYNELIHQYITIVSATMTYANILIADNQSQSHNLFEASNKYRNIKISTTNMSILIFFQFSFNYGVTLSQIIGKEKEGLIFLSDAYNILSTGLSQPILNYLKLKVLKALIITGHSAGCSLAQLMKYIDEFMTLCQSSEEQYYDMLCAKAVILYDIGEYSKTITVTSYAISLNPNRRDAYQLRGDAKVKLYMKKEALTDFMTSQNLNPGESSIGVRLINILNISSSFSLDSCEVLLLPTCQLPGHVAFETSKLPISDHSPIKITETLSLGPQTLSFRDVVSPISNLPSTFKVSQPVKHGIIIGDINPTPKKTPKLPVLVRSENFLSDGHNLIPKFCTASSNKPLRHISPINLIDVNTTSISNTNEAFDHTIQEKPFFAVSKAERHKKLFS